MAINPSKVDFDTINPVQNGDGITPEHINAPLRASAFTQKLLQNTINNTDIANRNKTPSLEIINIDSNNPQIKANNLIGASVVSQTFKGINSSTGGNVYTQTYSDGKTFEIETPVSTTLYIDDVDNDTKKHYKIRLTKDTTDIGENNAITFILG